MLQMMKYMHLSWILSAVIWTGMLLYVHKPKL